MHAVIAADRENVRISLELGIIGRDESVIYGGLMPRVVLERGDDADRRLTHRLEGVVVGKLALSHDLDLFRIHAALDQGFCQCRRLRAAGDEHENPIGV